MVIDHFFSGDFFPMQRVSIASQLWVAPEAVGQKSGATALFQLQIISHNPIRHPVYDRTHAVVWVY